MSKILKIAVSIVIIFVIAAPSCEEENKVTEEQEFSDMRKEILGDFSSDYLTRDEQFAHEQKAIQMLYEVHDYRKLISDTALDMDFRETIGRLLLQSYVQHATTGMSYHGEATDFEDSRKPVFIEQDVNGYLDNSTEYAVHAVDDVHVETHLHLTAKNEYSGRLAYTRSTIGSHNQVYAATSSTAFYVLKETKVFNNDTISVWQVKLGGS